VHTHTLTLSLSPLSLPEIHNKKTISANTGKTAQLMKKSNKKIDK
jgi:hypothetical protein